METRICKCCGRELPLEKFNKNAFGYTHVCNECTSKNRSEAAKRRNEMKAKISDAENARNLRLQDFTPRELLEELRRRGYEGKLRYVQVHEINLADM